MQVRGISDGHESKSDPGKKEGRYKEWAKARSASRSKMTDAWPRRKRDGWAGEEGVGALAKRASSIHGKYELKKGVAGRAKEKSFDDFRIGRKGGTRDGTKKEDIEPCRRIRLLRAML